VHVHLHRSRVPLYICHYRNIKPISAAQLSRYKEDSTIGVTSLCRWYSTSRYGCVRTRAQALHTVPDTAALYSSLPCPLFSTSLSIFPSILFWHILFADTSISYYVRFASRLFSRGSAEATYRGCKGEKLR